MTAELEEKKTLYVTVYGSLFCLTERILQECLDGEFVRVGPNPKFAPVAGYHWYIVILVVLQISIMAY